MCSISCFNVYRYMIPILSTNTESFQKQNMFLWSPSTNIVIRLFVYRLLWFFYHFKVHVRIFFLIYVRRSVVEKRIYVFNFRFFSFIIRVLTRFVWIFFNPFQFEWYLLLWNYLTLVIFVLEIVSEYIIVVQELFIKCIFLSFI